MRWLPGAPLLRVEALDRRSEQTRALQSNRAAHKLRTSLDHTDTSTAWLRSTQQDQMSGDSPSIVVLLGSVCPPNLISGIAGRLRRLSPVTYEMNTLDDVSGF